MTLPELLALLQKAPAALAELSAAAVAVSMAVGGLGTTIEHVGVTAGALWLEKLGQRLEAVGTDVPKLIRGSRYTNDLEATAIAAAKALERPQ